MLRTCSRCKRTMAVSMFATSNQRLARYCPTCIKAYEQSRRLAVRKERNKILLEDLRKRLREP